MRRVMAAGFAVALLACAGVPRAAMAQWGRLPDGTRTYDFANRTSGTFSCFVYPHPAVRPVDECTPSGSRVTFTHGGSSLSLRFTGAVESLRATPYGWERLLVGTVTSELTSDAPLSPNLRFPEFNTVFLNILMESTVPNTQSRVLSAYLQFRPEGLHTFLTYPHTVFSLVPDANGARYGLAGPSSTSTGCR
jgi:hypothetical protein